MTSHATEASSARASEAYAGAVVELEGVQRRYARRWPRLRRHAASKRR